MARKSGIGFDINAIRRARELQTEAQVLRRRTRALIGRTLTQDKTSVIHGISAPMLLEIAYDLTALGLHDVSRRCRALADELVRESVSARAASQVRCG